MNIKLPFVLLVASIIMNATFCAAQTTYEVPENVVLIEKDDYPKYEADVVKATNWLEATDLDKENHKRNLTSAFLLKWITGSPTVTVDISKKLSDIYGKNADLLMLYMARYSSHYIENKATATKASAIKAGLISIMNVYNKGINIKKSKEMLKVIKANEENKLDEYIADKLINP